MPDREKLTPSTVGLDTLKRLVQLHELDAPMGEWWQVEAIVLSEYERQRLAIVEGDIINEKTHLLNEATLWSRAIYPLLLIAERDQIRAWAGVSLKAAYQRFEIDGFADGVLGRSVAGRVEAPYLVIVETKRGIEGENPLVQLYIQLLAAARLNWEKAVASDTSTPSELTEIFGCYTIADSWTFVRGDVKDMESDRPRLSVISSREYNEKNDAATIVKILKMIVERGQSHQNS